MPGSTKAGKAKTAARNQPEQKFAAEGLSVVLWLNEVDTADGPKLVRNISLTPRRYKDRNSGEWRDGTSYRPTDLHVIAFLIGKAIDYVYSTPIGRSNSQPEPTRRVPGDEEPADSSGDDIPY